jgi:hypothetical protein
MTPKDRKLAHKGDLTIPCPNRDCLVAVGKECKGLEKGIVHIGRRIKRLLLSAGRMPS